MLLFSLKDNNFLFQVFELLPPKKKKKNKSLNFELFFLMKIWCSNYFVSHQSMNFVRWIGFMYFLIDIIIPNVCSTYYLLGYQIKWPLVDLWFGLKQAVDDLFSMLYSNFILDSPLKLIQ